MDKTKSLTCPSSRDTISSSCRLDLNQNRDRDLTFTTLDARRYPADDLHQGHGQLHFKCDLQRSSQVIQTDQHPVCGSGGNLLSHPPVLLLRSRLPLTQLNKARKSITIEAEK